LIRLTSRVCSFKSVECIHPDCIDCYGCCLLPEGLSRTEMMEALGAYGEEAKRRVLENIKKGVYDKKRWMYKQSRVVQTRLSGSC